MVNDETNTDWNSNSYKKSAVFTIVSKWIQSHMKVNGINIYLDVFTFALYAHFLLASDFLTCPIFLCLNDLEDLRIQSINK